MLPHAAIFCCMLQYFVTFCPHCPVKVHKGESRHFCNDPVCPDPVWKPVTHVRSLAFCLDRRFLVGSISSQRKNSLHMASMRPAFRHSDRGARALPQVLRRPALSRFPPAKFAVRGVCWLRTGGVNTNGAAAKVIIFVRSGKNIRPGTFGKINVG